MRPWEKDHGKPERIASALEIMIEAPLGGAATGAVSDVDAPTVAIKSLATEHPVSRVAEEATNNEVAEHPKKVARPVDRRPACCTPPRYRLPEGRPGNGNVGYLMVATSSPDIAPSCPDQLPQSWLPLVGKSKWPLCPPTER